MQIVTHKLTFLAPLLVYVLTCSTAYTTCCTCVPTRAENKCLTMETEQVFVFLWSRGDLDDGDGEAVGGRGEDS